MIARWGHVVARRAARTLLVSLLVLLGAGVFGAGVFDSLSNGGFDDPDSESARELALERETFGNRGVDVVAIYSHDTLAPGDVLRIWMEFQVNPPTVGSRSFAVALDDAAEPVVRIDRELTVLP